MTRLGLLLLLAVVLPSPCWAAAQGLRDTPYPQAVSARMTFSTSPPIGDWLPLTNPALPDALQIVPSVRHPNGAYVLSSAGVFFMDANNSLSAVPLPLSSSPAQSRIAAPSSARGRFDLALAGPEGWTRCHEASPAAWVCVNSPQALAADVTALALTDDGELWIGTAQGLLRIAGNGSSAEAVADVGEVAVTALAVFEEPSGEGPAEVAVGTELKLWRRLDATYWHFWYTNSNIDYNITALGFQADGTLWVGNRDAVNLQDAHFQFHRLAGYQLPYGNITSIPLLTGDGTRGVWLGSKWGLMRYDPLHPTEWRYMNGPRWLASPTADQTPVVSVAMLHSSAAEQVLVATKYGLARISIEYWTLAQKAEYMQGLVYPRHDRYGQTADCSLATFGNLSSWQPSPSDNDGLWTEIYMASQAYRYAALNSSDARANALNAWNAMHFMQQVTGLPGYPARSFARYGDPGTSADPNAGQHTWFNSTTYPGWVYKSDTSSDEIVGHQFGLPLYLDLVASPGAEQTQALQLFTNITDWILANHLKLVSPLGIPTTWGFWDPASLNGNPDDYDERGLNSLQILAWLMSAYRHTKDPRYMDEFTALVTQAGYGINIINQKVTVPNDDNYSDDELAWLPYATWLNVDNSPAFLPFKLSLSRSIGINGPEKSSLWNIIYLLCQGDDDPSLDQQLLKDAISTLQSWPLEQIEWPVRNSQRFDIVWRHFGDRSSDENTLNLLRYDELSCLRWNCDPYSPDGGSGYSEEDPGAWLLPYWMARYHKLIV
ncbi:MAG: hypothetical protein Q8P67_17935 [archaeon]|nr:hypothetical protein [archaeon]